MHEPAWMQSQPAKFIKIQSNPIPCYKPKETLSNRQQHTGKHLLFFFRSFSHRCFFSSFFLGASFPLGLWTRAGPEGWSPIQSSAKGLSPCRRNGASPCNVKSISWILECIGKLIKIQTSKNQGCKPFFEATSFMSLISLASSSSSPPHWLEERLRSTRNPKKSSLSSFSGDCCPVRAAIMLSFRGLPHLQDFEALG